MTDLEAKAEAIRRHAEGQPVQFAKGLDRLVVHGYGEFRLGDWEFPLPFVYLSSAEQSFVRNEDAKQIQSELR